MIKAVYDRPNLCLTIEGHAYNGEAGHDLVCASASILAYTLAASVTNAARTSNTTTVIRLEKGDAEVRCNPNSAFPGVIMLIFDTVCVGFELLARNYPENISYTIIE